MVSDGEKRPLTMDELSEVLAAEASMDVKEFREQAGETEIAPPWEAEVIANHVEEPEEDHEQ